MANSKSATYRPHRLVPIADESSRFEYVRNFEQADPLLPNTWIVVRVDGRAFTKYYQ